MRVIRIGNDTNSVYIDTSHILAIHDVFFDVLGCQHGSDPHAFRVTMAFRSESVVIGVFNATKTQCEELREKLVFAWKSEQESPIDADNVYSR